MQQCKLIRVSSALLENLFFENKLSNTFEIHPSVFMCIISSFLLLLSSIPLCRYIRDCLTIHQLKDIGVQIFVWWKKPDSKTYVFCDSICDI